ncbi:MAG: hypothetical protein IJ214_00160 [Clostridia bacterium]|nr:hypothetical protein [Clostridia bacterium]
MKAIRIILIAALTAAVLLAICAPARLQGIVPDQVISMASMEEFPLLSTCGRIARQLLDAITGHQQITADIVANALGEYFFDELISLVMVAMLTIPVSMVLGFVLYRPLYKGLLAKGLLYISLNLCSVMIAWIVYRHVYFRYLIEGLIQRYITDGALQLAANYITQVVSAILVGAVAVKIAVAVVAARLVLNKVIMPILGTLIRTLLFAFLVAQIMLLQNNPAQWQALIPMMLVTLLVSGISDGIFGS